MGKRADHRATPGGASVLHIHHKTRSSNRHHRATRHTPRPERGATNSASVLPYNGQAAMSGKMRRENVEAKFDALVAVLRKVREKRKRQSALTMMKSMVEEHPYLKDRGALFGLNYRPCITEPLPWLKESMKPSPRPSATASAKHSAKPSAWAKPQPPRGYKYQQCHKPNCRCMNGGAWHGPYRYRSEREGIHMRSIYEGKHN